MPIIPVFILLAVHLCAPVFAENMQAVQVYEDNLLLNLIKKNKHLDRIVSDDCQLVQDIEARASIVKMPSYQFLWGDMLAYGICVKQDISLGVYYMHQAADQGLAEGLEQLGRYYHIGKFMKVDIERAVLYLKIAASLDNLNAQMRLASLYQQGFGSPLDYPALYSQLHHSLTDNKVTQNKISELLADLANKMPNQVIEQAKRNRYTN